MYAFPTAVFPELSFGLTYLSGVVYDDLWSLFSLHEMEDPNYLSCYFSLIIKILDSVCSHIFLYLRTDQKLTSQVHEIVGRINGRFGTLTAVPIHHLVCL